MTQRRTPVKKKLAPKVHIKVRLRPDVLEMLRQGAEYHKTGYQAYMQWLLDDALKRDAKYYGWKPVYKKYIVKGATAREQEKLRKIMRVAEHRVKKATAP